MYNILYIYMYILRTQAIIVIVTLTEKSQHGIALEDAIITETTVRTTIDYYA